MTFEDELRSALHDEAQRADIRLEYPGDPAPARPARSGRRALAAAAATVALVGGVLWGAGTGGGEATPAGRHTVVPRHPQEHTTKDIPAAVSALPGVLADLKALAPVEDAAIAECMRTAGYPVLPAAPRSYRVDSQHEREALTVERARADGYGLAAVRAQYLRDAADNRRFEHAYPSAEERESVYAALIGSLGVLPENLTTGPVGADANYGGCIGQVRQQMYGRAELARAQIDAWPGADLPVGGRRTTDIARTPLIELADRSGAFVAANRAWAACMRSDGARDLVVSRMPAPAEPVLAGDPDHLMERISAWQATGRDAGSDAAFERRVAVADAACATRTGYRDVARRLVTESGLDPASLMRKQPELIDVVLDLDAAVSRLKKQHGID